jgi:beta-glucanase (GH16 family)
MRRGAAVLFVAMLCAAGARAAPSGEAASPPPQADAAGFHALVFVEDFAKLDVGASEAGGSHAWWTVPPRWERTPGKWQSAYALADGVATLTTRAADDWPNVNLISNISNASGQNQPRNGSFLFGYFEARLKFDWPIGAWPAFWLFSSKHLAIANPRDWSEIDIVEGQANTPDRLYFTLHWWEDTRRNHQNRGPDVRMPAGFDPTQFHKYGLLWVRGKVTWYVDDKAVLSAATWPINDTDPASIIVSAQANGWSKLNNASLGEARAISVQVSSIKVWQ